MKTRSYLLIAATLFIGIMIGFLLNGYLTHQKFQKFVHQSGEQVLKNRMMEVLQPDQSQIENIEPILDKYDRIAQENIQDIRNKMQKMHEELHRELETYLNPQQKEALEKWEQRRCERRERFNKEQKCRQPDEENKKE